MILTAELYNELSFSGSRMSGGDPGEIQFTIAGIKWFPHERG